MLIETTKNCQKFRLVAHTSNASAWGRPCICLQNGGNRGIVSAWGEVDNGRVGCFPLHVSVTTRVQAVTRPPGSVSAAAAAGGLCASSMLVGEGWTLDTPLTSLSDLTPVANSSATL